MEKEPVEEDAKDDTSEMDLIEQEFQDILTKMVGDESLAPFQEGYKRLFEALQRAHQNEKRLQTKVKKLQADISTNAHKVQSALRYNQIDKATIGSLKKEMGTAFKMAEEARSGETQAKESVQELHAKIKDLTNRLEQAGGLSNTHQQTIKDLMKKKQEAMKRVDDCTKQIALLKQKLEEFQKEAESQLDAQEGHKAMYAELSKSYEEMKTSLDREKQRLENSEQRLSEKVREFNEQKKETDAKDDQIKLLNIKIEELNGEISSSEGKRKATATIHARLKEENAELLNENSSLKLELQNKDHTIKGMEKKELESDKYLSHIQTEFDKLKKKYDQALAEVKRNEQKVEDERTEKSAITHQVLLQEKEMDSKTREIEMRLKQEQALSRTLQKKEEAVLREKRAVDDVKQVLLETEGELFESKDTEKRQENELKKQRQVIYRLTRDIEKCQANENEINERLLQSEQRVKAGENMIKDLQKDIGESEKKLQKQQQIYEQVRRDCGIYNKSWIDSQDTIAEMRRKFEIMSHQIQQLKDEIKEKNNHLTHQNTKNQQISAERDAKGRELNQTNLLLEQTRDALKRMEKENDQLQRRMKKQDEHLEAQRKEFDEVINERDILGTQLIRRNDELMLLRIKQKILQSILNKGEAQYRQKLKEMSLLKCKIRSLEGKLLVSSRKASQTERYTRQIYKLQEELVEERTKVKALSEDLENPMNVHRWRKLEGSDPERFELIERIATLQKRLIAKTEHNVEKDLIIEEKERLYQGLKAILARQPGPEVSEQLSVYQQNLRDKTRQMKAMASELNMYQAQINEYKYEIDRLSRDLDDYKSKFFTLKKEVKRADSSSQVPSTLKLAESLAQSQHVAAMKSGPRFTGGGFNLNA